MSIIGSIVDEIGIRDVIPSSLLNTLDSQAESISDPEPIDPDPGDPPTIRDAAEARIDMYERFVDLWDEEENVQRIKNNAIDPLNAALETTGITDRFEENPPPAETVINIAPLPAPAEALLTASDVLESALLVEVNEAFNLGSYSDITQTPGFDSPDATTQHVRDTNSTLVDRAQDVAAAAEAYANDPASSSKRDDLIDALEAEKEATVPLPGLEGWDEFSIAPYPNITNNDVKEYIQSLVNANASSIWGGRQEVIDTIDDLEGDDDCVEPNVRTLSVEGQASGGPTILMGLDSELRPGSPNHGPPEEHASMVSSLLDNVTNGGDGILVLGGTTSSSSTNVTEYWEGDVASDPQVDEDVTFVNGADDIRDTDLEGYAMIGIVSSDGQIPGGLTDAENQALIDRQGDIAAFVNQGGGLLGKTQDRLTDDWEYVSPLVNIEARSAGNSSIDVTSDGEDLGLTQSGMDGWCCYHESFEEDTVPDFLDILLRNPEQSDDPPAAIGGDGVILETAVELEVEGPENVAVNSFSEFDIELNNNKNEDGGEVQLAIEFMREDEIEEGDVELSDVDLEFVNEDEQEPRLVGVFPDEPFQVTEDLEWEETIEIEVGTADTYNVTLAVVGQEIGDTFAALPLDITGVGADPGICIDND